MKIIYIVNSSSFFCSHFLTLAKKTFEKGCAVYVIAGDNTEKNTIESLGFKFICISLSRSSINPLRELRFLRELRLQIKQIKPDIIHLFTVKPIVYAGIVLKTIDIKKEPIICYSVTGLGSVYLDQGAIGRCIWLVIKFLYKQAFSIFNSTVVFENKDDRDLFVQWGIVEADKTRIVNGAGIDTLKFVPSKFKHEKITIVLVARLLRDKGVAEYINAASILKNKNANVCFQLVGDIDDGNISSMSYEDIFAAHKLGYIEWLGHQSDIASIYSSAHIACLPSYREGLPKSLIEATSCGLPIITTNVPGCRQMVIDGYNGVLIEPRSVDAIVDAVEYLASNMELMSKMAINSRDMAIEKFDYIHIINHFHDIYKLN